MPIIFIKNKEKTKLRKDKDQHQKRGLSVKVVNNNVNSAISLLKKKVNEDGLKKELREREHFVSKAEKRRKNKAAAIRRNKKRIAEKQEL